MPAFTDADITAVVISSAFISSFLLKFFIAPPILRQQLKRSPYKSKPPYVAVSLLLAELGHVFFGFSS